MRGILYFILRGRSANRDHESILKPMPTRSYDELTHVLAEHGTAFRAAFDGAVNAEEYLRLEKLSEP